MNRITPGWPARHTPQGPGGRQAALIDIAQDLLLARLHQRGVFDHLVFKGGTALRKLYTGNAGRFSTDLGLLCSGDFDTCPEFQADVALFQSAPHFAGRALTSHFGWHNRREDRSD